MRAHRQIILCAVALGTLAGCGMDFGRRPAGSVYVVFFDEFSANFSPDARSIIDRAAAAAKQRHVRLIRVETRGNATGSPEATMKISETRAAVIRDALVADGVDASTIRLVPLGQMGTADTGVTPRRAVITLEGGPVAGAAQPAVPGGGGGY